MVIRNLDRHTRVTVTHPIPKVTKLGLTLSNNLMAFLIVFNNVQRITYGVGNKSHFYRVSRSRLHCDLSAGLASMLSTKLNYFIRLVDGRQ